MSGARNADISANIASMSGRFGCFSANDLYSSLFRSLLSFFTFLPPFLFFVRFNIDKTETISYYECATNQIKLFRCLIFHEFVLTLCEYISFFMRCQCFIAQNLMFYEILSSLTNSEV